MFGSIRELSYWQPSGYIFLYYQYITGSIGLYNISGSNALDLEITIANELYCINPPQAVNQVV